jgi:hypothetical protein
MEQTAARMVAAIDGLLGGGAAGLQLAIGWLPAMMWLGEERWRIREGGGVDWREKSVSEGSPFIASGGGRSAATVVVMVMVLQRFWGSGADAPGSATSRRRRGA